MGDNGTAKPELDKGGQGDDVKQDVNDLTPTANLKGLIAGIPINVKLRVVGMTAPQPTKNSAIFHCYLTNDMGYYMRLRAWGDAGDKLCDQIKIGSVVEFKRLELKPYYLREGETNITSSDKEFEFNSNNSKLIVSKNLPKEGETIEYPANNRFPPYWKYLAQVQHFDRHLAGRVTVLKKFEDYTWTSGGFNSKTVKKEGIYGPVGDSEMNKAFLFVQCDPGQIGPAKDEFQKGFQLRYQDGKAFFRGEMLWIETEYIYTSPVGEMNDVEESNFSYVSRSMDSGPSTSVKQESKDDDVTPPKKSRRSLYR